MTLSERLKLHTKGYTLFLALHGMAVGVLILVLWGLYLALYPGVSLYMPAVVPFFAIPFLLIGLGLGAIYLGLVLLAHHGFGLSRKQGAIVRAYLQQTLPLTYGIGKLWQIPTSAIMIYCVRYLNRLTLQQNRCIDPHHLLLLTPHCLQLDTCPHKVTRDVRNCKQCGRCQVGDLLGLSQKYGIPFLVVTGGTLARQMIAQVRPQAVIAVACERDLMSGMQDVFPIPVIGILNERPNGPCLNTRIDVAAVEEMIVYFIKGASPNERA